jgi:hypothetical protein
MKFNLQSKLGAWALIAILTFGLMPTVGCSGTTVAQNIVNWTPTIISAADTIDATVATLDPANAVLIALAGTTFDAAAMLVVNQAKTYLANPTASALQQLQAQALAFQSNVNTALLQAARITNPASQQKITVAINAAVTGISAILAIITTIKGSTLTPASVTAPKMAQVLPLIDERKSIALVAQHYGEPEFVAAYQVHQAERSLMAAGL